MATRLPVLGGHEQGFATTKRADAWWVGPGVTLGVLSLFIVYVNWALLQGKYYFAEPYLSPLYAPLIFTDPTAPGAAPVSLAWVGLFPSWWPELVPRSPAVLILAFPALFRFTCYYYRKAYYRAFAGSPPGCAVGPLASDRPYKGETGLMIFQNLHRYALYFALGFIFILSYDAFLSFRKHGVWGVGVGSIIMTVNAALIAGYTLGCHSFRHLIGGREDCMSCGKNTMTFGNWKRASWFNARHMQFAWASLVWVMFTDLYVRLVSMGVIKDLSTWG
jgi:hypothetical protein